MYKKTVLTLLVLLIAVPALKADRRKYVWTYQYSMVPKDAAELEFYQTTKLDESDSWEYRLEVEHGLTDDLDVAIYQIYSQPEGESFKWDAVQVRTRYRLADPGTVFLDPLLYLEYRRKIDLKEQNKLEVKLILGKDMDKVNFSINPLYEFFWASGEPKHELGADIGLSYAPSFKYSLGVESVVRYETRKGEESESSFYVGPSVSYASGPIFYTFGYLVGLTDDSNDGRVRFLMGVGL